MRAKIFAYITYKNPNFCTPEKFLKIILKFEHDGLSLEQEVQSDVYGVTNNVDTDEDAALGSWSGLFSQTSLSKYSGKLHHVLS